MRAVASQGDSALVHNITNWVMMNFSVNVLLAAGASPMMSHAHEEVSDMVGIAEALVLNIGTLDPYWVERMKLARAVATPQGLPTLLGYVTVKCGNLRLHRRSDDFFPYGGLNIHN
ncbi:MAG: hydroxyethylthiazole kinase [Polaromonas sp.]